MEHLRHGWSWGNQWPNAAGTRESPSACSPVLSLPGFHFFLHLFLFLSYSLISPPFLFYPFLPLLLSHGFLLPLVAKAETGGNAGAKFGPLNSVVWLVPGFNSNYI